MVTEEIHLNDFLEQEGIESIETDLGEYIQHHRRGEVRFPLGLQRPHEMQTEVLHGFLLLPRLSAVQDQTAEG